MLLEVVDIGVLLVVFIVEELVVEVCSAFAANVGLCDARNVSPMIRATARTAITTIAPVVFVGLNFICGSFKLSVH